MQLAAQFWLSRAVTADVSDCLWTCFLWGLLDGYCLIGLNVSVAHCSLILRLILNLEVSVIWFNIPWSNLPLLDRMIMQYSFVLGLLTACLLCQIKSVLMTSRSHFRQCSVYRQMQQHNQEFHICFLHCQEIFELLSKFSQKDLK